MWLVHFLGLRDGQRVIIKQAKGFLSFKDTMLNDEQFNLLFMIRLVRSLLEYTYGNFFVPVLELLIYSSTSFFRFPFHQCWHTKRQQHSFPVLLRVSVLTWQSTLWTQSKHVFRVFPDQWSRLANCTSSLAYLRSSLDRPLEVTSVNTTFAYLH